MPATIQDFIDLVESGEEVYLGDDAGEGQWRKITRALKGLGAFLQHKVSSGTEPSDVLAGLILGLSPNHNEWRLVVVGTDLLVQENTGTEGVPVWTTRNTFETGSGLEAVGDHGALGGLADDDHPHYSLASGARNITGSQTVKNTANATLTVRVDAGLNAGQIAQLVFADQGTDAWSLRKSTGGSFILRDLINNQDIATVSANSGADNIVVNNVGVGIKKAAADGKDIDVLGDGRVSGDMAAATVTASGAISGASVNATSANEVTRAWGVTEQAPSSSAGTLTLDFALSNYFEVLLTENITSIVINNTGIPGPRTIIFKQAAASSYTITGWPTVSWAGDAAPVMPTGFDDEKIITILVKSDGSKRGVFSDNITL